MKTQTNFWVANTGQQYTDRNACSVAELEGLYSERFGMTRTDMNEIFLGSLDRNIKILEIGCNIGNQLLILQRMGFSNLYGIEVQQYAVEKAKERTRDINIIQGNAFDVPFKNEWFDLVFTSGLLIHFAQPDVLLVMKELYRCTNKYIWCYEYYSDTFQEIVWRGQTQALWKADYVNIYLNNFPVKLIKEQRFSYREQTKSDVMFLMEKRK